MRSGGGSQEKIPPRRSSERLAEQLPTAEICPALPAYGSHEFVRFYGVQTPAGRRVAIAGHRAYMLTGVTTPYIQTALRYAGVDPLPKIPEPTDRWTEPETPSDPTSQPTDEGDKRLETHLLRVRTRTAQVLAFDGTLATVRADLNYQRMIKKAEYGDAQILDVFAGGSSLAQIETELEPDGEAQLTVTYGSKTQGGKANVMRAQSTLVIEQLLETDNPEEIATKMVRSVNKNLWRKGAAHTWRIVRADYELIDAKIRGRAGQSFGWYFFTFEFEYNPDTWDTTVIYHDTETGTTPSDLVVDTGIKTFTYADELPYETEFSVA